jgi:hypothetical protein
MATHNKNTFLQELRWRGFIEATTSDDLDPHLSESSTKNHFGGRFEMAGRNLAADGEEELPPGDYQVGGMVVSLRRAGVA